MMIARETCNKLLGLLVFCVVIMPVAVVAGTVRDVDGNDYRTVKIAGMTWMAKNLEVRHYANGDPIRHAVSSAEWKDAARKQEGAWSYYLNSSANGKAYGKLYNWYAVNDPRGLAPAGWRVPSDKEWETLAGFLGGKIFAARKLKADSVWDGPAGSSDQYGFRALPGGYRRNDGCFFYKGSIGLFWSSTKFVDGYAWFRNMNSSNSVLFRNDTNMGNGLTVRCIKE